MGVVYPGRFCSLLMDESLLPREIPVGGVGTCRCDCSDMGVDNDDCKGRGGEMYKMRKAMGREGGRKEIVIYICYCWLEILCPKWGEAEGHRSVMHPLLIFPFRFPVRRYFPSSSKRFKTCVRFYAHICLLLRPDLVPDDRQAAKNVRDFNPWGSFLVSVMRCSE